MSGRKLPAERREIAGLRAEREALLTDAAVEFRCPECGNAMVPWQHSAARAEIASLRKLCERAVKFVPNGCDLQDELRAASKGEP